MLDSLAAAFNQSYKAIDSRRKSLFEPAWPHYIDRVDSSNRAQPEVQT